MKKFNSSALPYLAAVSSAVLMTYAAVECWGVWGWVIGPGVGVTSSLSVATASSQIGSITAKGRRVLAYVMLFLMLGVGPATVALSLYQPESAWTATAWGAAVDVSIVLAGAISGKGFVSQGEPMISHMVSESSAQVARNKKKIKRQPITDSDLLAFFSATPGATDTQVAQHFGVTRQAIGKRREKLYKVSG